MSSPTLAPPAALTQGVPQTVTVTEAIDAQVSALEKLPDVSNSHAPSLQGDLARTRQDAAQWDSSVRPAVASALDGISAFSATFDEAYAALDAAAAQILGGDASAIAAFQAALGPLEQQTRAQIALVGGVEKQIDGYQSSIDGDVSALEGDESRLTAAQQADQQQIQSLQGQITELEDEIEKKHAEMLLLGLLSPLALGLKEAIDALTGRKDSTQQALDQARADLSGVQRDLSQLGAVNGTVQKYLSVTESLAGSIQSLSNGWAVLGSNLEVLLESEDITTFNAFTGAQLAAMKADWDDLARQAAELGRP